jgi:predicted CXXCH cytochrome family protein
MVDSGSSEAELCQVCHDVSPDARSNNKHAPFEAGECSSCHNAHVAEGENLLPATTAEACYECHDGTSLYPELKLAHAPVREGQCELCHESHESQYTSLLKASGNELCFGCHENVREKRKLRNQHQPFARGDCAECHEPHGSATEGMLVKSVPGLCVDCHDVTKAGLGGKHGGIPFAESNCVGCHDPHASREPNLAYDTMHAPYAGGDCQDCHDSGTGAVLADQKALCYECHQGMGEDLKTVTLHQPLADERSCTVCHAAHAAPTANLLPVDRDKPCKACHGEQAGTISTATFVHPVQAEGTCSVCHDPHVVAYEGGRNLADRSCLRCHTTESHASHPMGDEVADPRGEGTVECASCHGPHGTEQEYFLLDDPNGRLCVGCHTDKIRSK